MRRFLSARNGNVLVVKETSLSYKYYHSVTAVRNAAPYNFIVTLLLHDKKVVVAINERWGNPIQSL